MKIKKRLMAFLMTIIMTLTMGMSAFADTEADANVDAKAATQTGSLTVKVNADNTLENQTIYLYKLFDLSVNGDKYAYTVNNKYEAILKTVLNITDDPVASGKYYEEILKLSGDAVQTFANAFTKAVLEAKLTADETSGKLDKDDTSYTFSDLDYGYYLVYQTGTKEFQSSLTSVDDATNEVALKGTAPSIDKTADEQTVEIGQIVTYTVTGTIPDTTGYDTYTYKIHDKLTDGLDFVENTNGTLPENKKYDVSVKIDGKDAEIKEADIDANDDRKMTLDLSAWVKANQDKVGTTFTVTYYAKVNEAAVVENKNSASLEYGNNAGDVTTTTPSVVTTPTYPLDINKTDTDGTMLADAKFRLYKDDAGKPSTDAIKVTGSNGSYTVAEDQATETNMDMTTIATEVGTGYNLRLNGLAAGTYWLVETDAPAGYNKITEPIKITITKTGDTTWTVDKNNTPEPDKVIDVENSSGKILPETGGMGTILFTAVSVLMIFGVAVSFVISRRKPE